MRSNSNHQQYSENLRLVPIFFLGTKIFKDRFWEFFIRNYCHVLFWARKRRVSPPPLNWWKSKKFSLEAALFLAQKVNGKKLTERGGTPLSLTDGQFLKTQREKVDGKGGYPPPPPPKRTFSVTRGFEVWILLSQSLFDFESPKICLLQEGRKRKSDADALC